MTAGQPWSVKGIDPKAREAAKDLARRSGMTLGEWLNQVILEDGAAETSELSPLPVLEPQPTPQPFAVRPTPVAPIEPAAPVFRRAEAPVHSQDEAVRLSEALDVLATRIESAEARTAQMVGGVDQSVSSLLSRLDEAGRENAIGAARFESVAEDIRADQTRLNERMNRVEEESAEPGSAEALQALEGTIAKVAGHVYDNEAQTREALDALRGDVDGVAARLSQAPEDNAALIETMVARIAERLDQAEARTTGAIQALEASFGVLDSRLGAAEALMADQASGGALEQLAVKLSADVDAARSDMAEQIQAAASGRLDRVERALQEMTDHVQVAERRSSDAVERMGHEVLRLAEALGRKIQDVEARSTSAIEQVGGDVARIADTVEERFNRADAVSAQALEKLGGEIARITERLAERIGNAERRSAQAIDDVGDQVARVTERLQERQERSTSDLADRIRQSEERTARLLEDTRLRLDQRLGEMRAPTEEAPADAPSSDLVADEAIALASLAEEDEGPFAHPRAEVIEEAAHEEPALEAAPFEAARFEEPEFEGARFDEPALLQPAFTVPDALEREAAETAFEARVEDEPAAPFGVAAFDEPDAREPDLIEPSPMNFVAERFGEPGPILFQAPYADEPEAFAPEALAESEEAFGDDPFEAQPFEPETREAATADLGAGDEDLLTNDPLDEETAEDAFGSRAFEPASFAPNAFVSTTFISTGLDRDASEAEPAEAHARFDEPEQAFEAEETEASFKADEPLAEERFEEERFEARSFDDDPFGEEPGHTALAAAFEAEPLAPAAEAHGEFDDEPAVGERPFEASLGEEPLPFGQAAAEEPAVSHRAMSTRELIEQARAAARAAAAAADPKARKAAKGGGLGLPSLGFGKPKRRDPSAMGAALMISGGMAVLGMGAAGYVLLAGHPQGVVPPRVMAALGLPDKARPATAAPAAATADPMAAVALSPQPSGDLTETPAAPAATTTAADSGADLYGDAVRRIEARDFSGVEGLRKAANLGYAPAQFYLAKLFETGEAGLKKDLGEARRWTERAAQAGDKKAMHNLALYYVEGSGGPKNTTTAAQWFRRAADLGLVDSQYNLGRLYEEGFGVAQNPAEAYKWYLIAAHAGDAESRASAQRLKGQLSAEAQAAAERSAGAFQAQGPRPAAASQLAQATTGGDVAGAAIAQRALSRLGYYQGPTDGSASPALKGAIAAYQRDQGLPATGVPDAALSQRLAVIAQ